MNFFRNFEDLIDACSSYDVIIRKAAAETEEEHSSVLNSMLGVIRLAELKARRFLDQFGQFDKLMTPR